jgi:N-methylhydantoinase A
VIHGTTRVTNAIVEGNLPEIALAATAGFEDSLEIGRLSRAHLYRLDLLPRAPALVPPERRFGVRERISFRGEIVEGLSEGEIEEVVDRIAATGVASVAVAFLHSYANGEHERRLGDALTARGLHVSLSHKINPEAREFERTSVTVLNAAITPIAIDYLNAIEEKTRIGPKLKLFHSAGGMATPEAVKARPLTMALSGPAAGVAASARLAREIACDQVLTFDMGGTTTDVCLILEGKAEVADNREIAERPLRMPMVAVDTIGAGGGSIIRVGAGGIAVGPDSAGAQPGPACYGLGGTEATVTDVNVALGYLDSEQKLGGKIRLDPGLAEAALGPLAQRLGLEMIPFALGATRVANATMARALRRVTVERGIDGRNCTLFAFGGAAPMHAAGLAGMYGVSDVVIPIASSVFSANGCVFADTSYSDQRTLRMTSDNWDPVRFEMMVEQSKDVVVAPLLKEGAAPDRIRLTHIALVRYVGQSSLVEVPLDLPHVVEATARSFRERHEALYGFATDEAFEIQSLRTIAVLPSQIEFNSGAARRPVKAVPRKHSKCWFDVSGPVETPRYDRADLGDSDALAGPLIVEDANSTVVVPPDWRLRVDAAGNLFLEESS